MESTDERAPTDPAPGADAEPGAGRASSGVSINQVVALLLVVVGLRVGLDSLHDNSFFTHLATGRLILDHGGIPRTDPYSFTAHGHPWTVQSWGASVIFAGIERAFGLVGIRVLVALCTVVLVALIWRLTSSARGLVGRLAIVVPVIGIGSGLWVERPLLFSLLFLMAVLFALEDRLDARWMVPILWLWVNVHGSFPLGLAAIGTFLVGRLLDRERPTIELRVLGWATLGTALGGLLSPLGWRLLVFPVHLLGRRDAFSQILEWQPPKWHDGNELFFAVQLALAVALILTRGRRWRNIVPVVAFAAISLQSTRNIVHASLVMIPAMTAAAAGLGALDGRKVLPILKPVRAVLVALLVLVAVIGIRQPDTNLIDYPVDSTTWMVHHHLLDRSSRVVSRDFVGNYLEVRYGPDEVRVFVDDRVDMFPLRVLADYTTLIDPEGDYAAVLRRNRATAVLWDKDSAFGDWLEDPAHGWKIVHTERLWMVAVPAKRA